jgi:hypothetical protein
MKRRILGFAGTLGALLSVAGEAHADPLTVTFSGHIDMVQDRPGNTLLGPAGIAVGSPFTGALTYDTTASPNFGGPICPGGGPYGGICQSYFNYTGFSFTVQGNSAYTFGFPPGTAAGFYVASSPVTPGHGTDSLQAGTSGGGFAVATPFTCIFSPSTAYYGVLFSLADSTSFAPISVNSLPTTYDLTQFDTHTVDFYCYQGNGGTGGTDYRVHGNIESISPAPAPPPDPPVSVPAGNGLSWLVGAGLLVLVGLRRLAQVA